MLQTTAAAKDNTRFTIPQDDLVQALNQENRVLADRIQELLSHIEDREEEMKREDTQLRELISTLQMERVRLEQENQEQGCLITELTKKTEDDLNTIMELQQQLVEGQECVEESQVGKDLCGFQPQSDTTAATSAGFLWSNLEARVEGSVDDVLKVEPSDSLHASLLSDQVDNLTRSVQSLKMEQEALSDSIDSLREQQREVALSVQTQTDVKQQLTRTVWGLKDEKDGISRSLEGLRQEQEQLTRAVRGLRDERDQFTRSTSGLTEEKEQLTETLLGLKTEKEKLLESLSSGREERDELMCLLQSLKTEREQLSQGVLSLKQEKEELTNSLKYLKQQRDEGHRYHTLEEDRDKLVKLVSGLREDKERIELSIATLKTEEEQIKSLQGLRGEGSNHKAAVFGQMQTGGRRDLLDPNSAATGEPPTQRPPTNHHRADDAQVLREERPCAQCVWLRCVLIQCGFKWKTGAK